MTWTRWVLLAALLGGVPATASAQRPTPSGMHRFEITPFYGYSWTFARDFYYGLATGRADINDSPMWGIALDINLPYKPGSQVELLYNRQDSDLRFTTISTAPTEVNMAVEYWHIGGLYGVQRGNVMPFGMMTLGGSRFSSDDFNDDVWKFSMIFGFGAKIYASNSIGLRVQGRFPFSIFSGGGSVGCGSGGCYTSVGGTGMGQFDVSAGVTLLL